MTEQDIGTRVKELIEKVEVDYADGINKRSTVYGTFKLHKYAKEEGFNDIEREVETSAWIPLREKEYEGCILIHANARDCGELAKRESGLIIPEDIAKLAGMEANKDYTPYRFPETIVIPMKL